MDDAQAGARGRPAVRPRARQAWATSTAVANQKLRLQTQNALKIQRRNPFRTPSLFEHRAPGPWLKRDRVPTFLVGQFQDEQTGGHFAESLRYLERATRTSGSRSRTACTSTRSGRRTITRWAEFLKLYVADEVPAIPHVGDLPQRRALQLPRRRCRGPGAAVALRRHHRRGRRQGGVRARPARAGADGQRRRPAGPGLDRSDLGARVRRAGRRRRLVPTRYFLGERGALGAKPAKAGSARYTADPQRPARARRCPATGREDAWKAQPPYEWAPLASGKGVGLRDRGARPGRGDRRSVEPRPLPQVIGARHRPPGDAQRGAPRRQRDLRPERLAARLAPQARRRAVHHPRSVPDPPEGRRRAAAARRASRWYACRSTPWPTPSAPARGSA